MEAGVKRERLQEFLQACAQQKYEFGKFDCVNFAAKAASAILNKDLLTDFKWAGLNKLEMMQVVVDFGGPEKLLDHVATSWGFSLIDNPLLAQYGDIAFSPRLNSIGVVEHGVLFFAPNGLCRVNLEPDMLVYRI